MAEDKKDEPKPNAPTFTKEELDEINKDIASAKDSLVSKETQAVMEKAKEAGKEEAKQEIEAKQKIDDMAKANEELKTKLEEQEKKASEQLGKMEDKINNLVESKQVIASENPFESKPALSDKVDKMTNEQVDEFEENSARDFFGQDYDRGY